MCENELEKLSREVRQIAGQIATMKKTMINMEPGPEQQELQKLIRGTQYQALFYCDKMSNLGGELRTK